MGNGCDERISYFQLLSQEGETTNWYDIQRNMYFCLLGGKNAPPQLSNRNNQISNLFVVSLSLQPSLVYLHHTLAMNIIEYLSLYIYIYWIPLSQGYGSNPSLTSSLQALAQVYLVPQWHTFPITKCQEWMRWSKFSSFFLIVDVLYPST